MLAEGDPTPLKVAKYRRNRSVLCQMFYISEYQLHKPLTKSTLASKKLGHDLLGFLRGESIQGQREKKSNELSAKLAQLLSIQLTKEQRRVEASSTYMYV